MMTLDHPKTQMYSDKDPPPTSPFPFFPSWNKIRMLQHLVVEIVTLNLLLGNQLITC